jgi:hypothetical protein
VEEIGLGVRKVPKMVAMLPGATGAEKVAAFTTP